MCGVQGPESDVMALPRAVIDRLLEADVLAASEKIQRAERGRRIRRVEHECPDQAPRAGEPQRVRLGPAESPEGGAKPMQRSNKRKIDRIARQSVARHRVARHEFALEDFKAEANDSREYDVGGRSIGDGDSQNPWQPVVGGFKDNKDDQ